MAKSGWRRSRAWSGRLACLWSKASTPRFRFIGASSPMKISASARSTPNIWSASSSAKSCAAKLPSSRMIFPRLCAILDVDLLSARSLELASFASELHAAGIQLLQYRNKHGSVRAMLRDAAELRKLFAGTNTKLLFNDRADLALLSGFDGVHVGQEDLSAEDARGIVGPNAWVGVSTHTLQQVLEANATNCDYIAYGPVFPTASKNKPDPVVGLAGL